MRHADLLAFLSRCTSSFAQNITELPGVDSPLTFRTSGQKRLSVNWNPRRRAPIACENRTARILIIEGNLDEATDLFGKLSSPDPYLSTAKYTQHPSALSFQQIKTGFGAGKLSRPGPSFNKAANQQRRPLYWFRTLVWYNLPLASFNQALEFSAALTTRLKLHGAESEEVAAACK